ncbi:hypothetical protein MN116_000270 [Schistosoma mekongi]|uniref:Integrase catalytic domain-containing protein n=1 Tax=Schistosoma mekongi TaxID=38744 RepID=A0AAE2D224_SCHME|nr:hypothetical protein MN116_000270 [Schistosoma mekongi]
MTEAAIRAFEQLKGILSSETLLARRNHNAPLALSTDASNIAVGAVLQQRVDGHWQPLSFFSKRLNDTQTRYSTFGRELLAMYLAIKHFRHMLEGSAFTIFTDHKPLTKALTTNHDRYTPRESRHLEFISQFTSDIQYIKGKRNEVADALSRVSSITFKPANVDCNRLSQLQQSDDELARLRSSSTTSLVFEEILIDNVKIVCDVSTGRYRPYIPHLLRHGIFESMHNISHPGVKSTTNMIRERFIWPNLNRDVRRWTQSCNACQSVKIQRHTSSALGPFHHPDSRFEHIHIDVVGPLPPSNGFSYIFTCIDRFTRWPVAVPMKESSAESIAKALVEGWISNFGIPAIITTDRGAQFESSLFQQLTELLGVKRIRTTAYHPMSNGMVERLHRQLKNALAATMTSNDWATKLPIVMLGIRATIKQDIGCSASELVYGTTLRLPGEITPITKVSSDQSSYVHRLRRHMKELKLPLPRKQQKPVYIPKHLSGATQVFVRRDGALKPLQPAYDGPYKVLRKTDKVIIVDKHGKPDAVSIDRVKPAFSDDDIPSPSNLPVSQPDIPSNFQHSQLPEMPRKSALATPRITRSGRHVHWPKHLVDIIIC